MVVIPVARPGQGAEVDARDRDEQFSALFFAAREGHADVVRLLLEHGATPDFVDADGERPIDFARQEGHSQIVRLLEDAMRRK